MRGFYKWCLLSVMVMPISAQAGFQFSGPVNPQSQPQVGGLLPAPTENEMPAVPAEPVIQQPMSVVPQQAAPQPQRPSPQLQSPIISSAPQNISPINQMPEAVQQPIRWNPESQVSAPMSVSQPSSNFEMAVGFGNDLPLMAALDQIIPEGYNYNIDPNLAVGQKVTWQGGRAWPDVLDDALAPLGYQASIQGTQVRITGNAPQMNNRQNQFAMAPQSQALMPQQPRPVMMDAPQPILPMSRPVTAPTPSPYAQQASLGGQPTNLLSQQSIPAVPMVLENTEAEDIAEQEKSIVPDVTTGQWTAISGTSLKTTLEAWSNIEGVDLFWSSDYDYPLVGDVNISGSYEDAVKTLLAGFEDAKPRPVGRLHPNLPHGPAVLLVETRQVIE